MMAVAVETEPIFREGNSKVLFDLHDYSFNPNRNYAVAPDGQRFLMIKRGETEGNAPTSIPRIEVVLSWSEELKRLGPVD